MVNTRTIWQSTWNGPIVVVGVIGLVVCLTLPAIHQAREAARRTMSRNNLKQIALALANYHDVHAMFPPGGVFDAQGKSFHGWTTFITPYLDANPWYNKVNSHIAWDDPDQIEQFQCGYWVAFVNPSLSPGCGEDGVMRVHYAGSDLIFYRNSSTRDSDLSNGTSRT